MILSWAALAFFLLPAPDFAPSSFFSFSENRFNILKLRSGTQAIESAPTHITLDSCNRSLLSNASALQIFCNGLKRQMFIQLEQSCGDTGPVLLVNISNGLNLHVDYKVILYLK